MLGLVAQTIRQMLFRGQRLHKHHVRYADILLHAVRAVEPKAVGHVRSNALGYRKAALEVHTCALANTCTPQRLQVATQNPWCVAFGVDSGLRYVVVFIHVIYVIRHK
jgi:hypothetical protein